MKRFVLAAMVLAGPAFGQDEAAADAETEAAEAAQAAADAGVIHDCAWLLTPDVLPDACMWAVSSACFDAAGGWTAAKAVACYGREQRGWEAWGARMMAEAKDRLPAGAAEAIDAAEQAWATYRDAACAAEQAAYADAEDGALAAAKCRMRKAAERAVELRMIGVP